MSILDSLAGTESGGSFTAQNDVAGSGGNGHFGRLQFSRGRLQDAERAGVIPPGVSPQQFLSDPAMQQRVETWHLQDMTRQAERMGLMQYVGQNINGTPITLDSILAMGHLGGMGGAAQYLRSGGSYNPQDAYGTSLSDYAATHNNPGTPSQAGQAPSQPQTGPTNALGQPDLGQPHQNALGQPQAPEQPQLQWATNALDPAAFQQQQQAVQPTNFLQYMQRG